MSNMSSALGQLAGAFCAVVAMASVASAADPQNILFFGNSYTHSAGGVPSLMQSVAVAAGHTRPNVEMQTASGWTLGMHVASSGGVISSPQDFTPSPGFKWDYVVLQEYSTKPTNIPGYGNPASFKSDANTLYNMTKAHSPNVKPVLYETWSRSPLNSDLATFYPFRTQGQTAPYYAAADQMTAELKQYYTEAQGLIGNGARLAPVGEAFKANNYAGIYDTDLHHPNGKGALLAALVMYETIYQEPASRISYSSANAQLGLSYWGVPDATEWSRLTGVATSVVPEPTTIAVLGGGSLLVLRRRRAKAEAM